MNIEKAKAHQDEIKKIWIAERDKQSLRQIFKDSLENQYFESTEKEFMAAYMTFVRMIRVWRREEAKVRAKNMTPEEEVEIQKENKRLTILSLNRLLRDNEMGIGGKDINIDEVRRLFRAIQMADIETEKLALARRKEKREVARLILPYLRLTPEKLIELKEKFNESFKRLEELSSGTDKS